MSDCRKCADYEWCAEHEECGLFMQKTMTNADRIRAMTDEELAAWIADHPLVSEYDENNPQHKAWLDWLKQEVET